MLYHVAWNKLHSTCIDLGLFTEVFWRIKSEKGELHWLASNLGRFSVCRPAGLVWVDFVVIEMDQAFLLEDFFFLVIPKSFRSCLSLWKNGFSLKSICSGEVSSVQYLHQKIELHEIERTGWKTTRRIHLAQIAIELREKIFCGLNLFKFHGCSAKFFVLALPVEGSQTYVYFNKAIRSSC